MIILILRLSQNSICSPKTGHSIFLKHTLQKEAQIVNISNKNNRRALKWHKSSQRKLLARPWIKGSWKHSTVRWCLALYKQAKEETGEPPWGRNSRTVVPQLLIRILWIIQYKIFQNHKESLQITMGKKHVLWWWGGGQNSCLECIMPHAPSPAPLAKGSKMADDMKELNAWQTDACQKRHMNKEQPCRNRLGVHLIQHLVSYKWTTRCLRTETKERGQ